MDDLIEELRNANPEPRPDPLPIGPIWDRLSPVKRRRRRRVGPRHRSLEQVLSGAAVALVIGVSVVIMVFVGLSVRGRTTTRPNSASRGSTHTCSLVTYAAELPAVRGVLNSVQLLRSPTTAQDQSAAACQALAEIKINPIEVATDPGYKLQPADLRYVGLGILGGKVFMYALPGAPHAIAYHGVPADSGLARSEVQPSVCLITVNASQPASAPGGCTNLESLRAGPRGFGAAQIEGTARSVLSGVVRDGVIAVRVYDRAKLIKTVPVEHNVMQFIVDYNAPAAVYLRIQPVK